MTTLKLGQVMRDKVSKFTGIADVQIEFLTGNVQYSLAPQFDPTQERAQSAAKAFDAFQLEYVGEGVDSIESTYDGVKLGEKVKDIVTGIVGIPTMKSTFLNGCVYFDVAIETKEAKDSSSMFFDGLRLKRVSAGVTEQIKKAVPAVKTGGPSYCVPERR